MGASPTYVPVIRTGIDVAFASVAVTGAAAATDVITAKITGDTTARLTVDADGTLRWSDGTAAPDISINRYAAGGLEVSGALRFTNGQLLFRADGSVNVYSSGVNTLHTDNNLDIDGTLTADGFTSLAAAQTSGNLTVFGSALVLGTAGTGLQIKEGVNATSGVATLVAGTVTVNTTKATATSRIQLTAQTSGAGPGALRVSARVAGTSFTITSTSVTDTSDVAWTLIEPAA